MSRRMGIQLDRDAIAKNMRATIDSYNFEVDRWQRAKPNVTVDDFVLHDEKRIRWSRDLKADIKRGRVAELREEKIRTALYRRLCGNSSS